MVKIRYGNVVTHKVWRHNISNVTALNWDKAGVNLWSEAQIQDTFLHQAVLAEDSNESVAGGLVRWTPFENGH